MVAALLLYAVFLIFCEQYFLQNFNCISCDVSTGRLIHSSLIPSLILFINPEILAKKKHYIQFHPLKVFSFMRQIGLGGGGFLFMDLPIIFSCPIKELYFS